MTRSYAARRFGDGDFAFASTPWGGRLADLLAIAIPLSQFAEFNIVGRLFAPDIMLLALLPFVLFSRGRVLTKGMPGMFLVMGFVWLLGQILTDLVRSIPFEDYSRGWAMIGFTLTNFMVLYVLLSESSRRIILYTFGFAGGGILTYVLNPSIYAVGEPWKFGYGFGVTVLVVLVAVLFVYQSRYSFACLVLFCAATLNLYEGVRSMAGICFLAAAYLIVQRTAHDRQNSGTGMSFGNAVAVFAILVLASVAMFQMYGYCASNGLLGNKAWEKYEIESSGRYGILVGGRPEFIAGLEAVMESPILGHGSWAKDWRYGGRAEAIRANLGYGDVGPSDTWVIPSHSHLIGAWVDAGILGAIFWLWVLFLPLRVLRTLYLRATPLAPLIAFFAIVLIWDIMFSPYGAERRFMTPFYLVVMLSFLAECRESKQALGLSG
jgi:hypothetical protein